MVALSPAKVASQTARQIRRSQRAVAERSITYYAAHPDELERRLGELNEEWDVERIVETESSTGSLLGLTLGYLRSARWYLLPLAIHEFILQHALFGRLPSIPVLGRLGFRTRNEITFERRALEALRSAGRNHVMVAVDVDFQVRPWSVRALPPAAIVSA